MKSATPYLFFDGNCREAMTFYKEVFGGELQLMTYADAPGSDCPQKTKDRIMHGALVKGSFVLLASDTPDDAPKHGSTIFISLECESLEEIERAFSQLSRGGSVLQPLHDAFWGPKFGMVTDRFGFSWMLSTVCENGMK